MKGQSPSERLARVNANDQVIGSARRDEIHRNHWLHRAVHILVEDPGGRILLQRRSRFKDTAPGKWDSSASGHVDHGESYNQSASREVREELGIRPGSLKNFGKLYPNRQNGWEFFQLYHAFHSGPFCSPPEEIEFLQWFLPAEIEEMLEQTPEEFAGAFLQVWDAFRRFKA